MKRHIRLVTRCGCTREMDVPSLKLTFRVSIDRQFIGMAPDAGGFVFERTDERRFEHFAGTGIGGDVAIYEEVASR
jgi:hypothetical protein